MGYLTPSFMINHMLNLPFGSDVVVVSDSQYKEMQQKQAELEITSLQKRLDAYESSAERLRETISSLQKEHGLLPKASDE